MMFQLIQPFIHSKDRQQSPTQQKSWNRLYKTQNKCINLPLSLSLFLLNKHFTTKIFFQSTAEGFSQRNVCHLCCMSEARVKKNSKPTMTLA